MTRGPIGGLTRRGALITLAALLPVLVLGAWLWRTQGASVWLQGAIAYCF